ncbi:lipocalin [Roseivivax halodurans JCM 10272]|uniref:Lipocalin n=1 Tax=Roseivivax halodurans JCM 10272 TaxID=1449350 RepID=X7EKV8_9RHOB|nr:hypothetical protein [Roseivivax halodurans]ETX16510.1 lipocalin [Roseivivax halodurans JCM 10272]
MKRVLICLALAGCGAAPAPDTPATLRDPAAPVGAQMDVTADRLHGEWRIVEGAGVPPGASVSIAPGCIVIAGDSSDLVEVAPGRFSADGAPLWVHWLDADARTVAMGDPGGGRVFVLDRTGAPGERLIAAREILDWYGYDLAALRGS